MLTRWDPFQDMLNLRRIVDRFFDNVNPDNPWAQSTLWGSAVDVVKNKDDFIVKASVPDISFDDQDISYADDSLTIKGKLNQIMRSRKTNITCVSVAMDHFPAALGCLRRSRRMQLKPLTKMVCFHFVYQNLSKKSRNGSPSRLAIKKCSKAK